MMRMAATLSFLAVATLPSAAQPAAQTVEIYSAGSAGNMIRALSKEPGLAGIEMGREQSAEMAALNPNTPHNGKTHTTRSAARTSNARPTSRACPTTDS